MGISAIYAGVEQADVATLTTGGVTYKCFVWKAASEQIEAVICVDGQDGQLVLVDSSIVATADGEFVDCPRVLATGSTFIVHWIDVSQPDPQAPIAGANLYRSIFGTTDIAGGWSNQGRVAIHTTLQYDHAIVIGQTDIMVSRRTAAGTIATTRYVSPFSWLDTDWTTTSGGLTIADTVLAVHAYEVDDVENVVLVSYQDTLLLRTIRMDATTGGNVASAETFPDLRDGDNYFTAVTHVRISENTFLVCVEAASSVEVAAARVYRRMVGWRAIASENAARLYESQWLINVHLGSRLWTWASGVTGGLEAYVALTFKSIADGQEFDQQWGYIARLDVAALAGANAAGVVRAIPVSAIMTGAIDARPHGFSLAELVSIGSRLNHLSHVASPPQYTLGPAVKAVTYATVQWSRLAAAQDSDVDTELQPIGAGVGWVSFFHEPAWMVRRTDVEPTQPDTPAWKGASPTHSLPVETPAGLVWTGGITSCYDGRQIVELGYLWTPEITVAVSEADAIGNDATYYWYVNTVWTDRQGQLHRGPPSRPVGLALVSTQTATMTIRCCNFSMKDDRVRYPGASRIFFEVWRTTADGGVVATENTAGVETFLFRSEFGENTVGYRLQDLPENDPLAWSISVAVGRPNNIIVNNALAPYQLDTTSLQWSPPPPIPHQPLDVAAVWQNRLFGVDPLGMLRWSEEILELGTQLVWPEFLDTNIFRLDGVGRVIAIEPLDSMLVIFARDETFALTGDPGAGGSGGSFNLQHVAKGIGCICRQSVASYSEGIFFQSSKGIHRFTRGQGIEYVGAPIEDLVRAAGNVRSAVHLENRHKIVFGLQAEPGTGPLEVRPRLAIFDYRVGLWSVRTMPGMAQSSTASRLNENQHATSWRGLQGEVLHVVLQQGGLAIERPSTDTVYADVGAAGTVAIPLDVSTEWIHVAGVAGLHRVKEIGIQTERVNTGPLTVEVWFDVEGRWDDSVAAQQVYTYTTAPEFISIRPRYEKMSGFKLRIYEPSSCPQTENVRLVSMTIAWAAKPTLRRNARL